MADNNTFSTIDYEGTSFGHQREIAHEYAGFLHLTSILVQKTNFDVHRCRIGFIPLLALLNAIFRFAQIKVFKVQLQIASEILDWRNVMENIIEACLNKPLIGFPLDVNQMRHWQYFIDSCITVPSPIAYGNRFKHVIPHPFIYYQTHKSQHIRP